jgi:diguanylate cyclase (GGDEF)-like protein
MLLYKEAAMAKKKIAVFGTGWASDILANFMKGMHEELASDNTDIYLFLNYANPGELDVSRKGDLTIIQLPRLSDFDGVVVISNLLDYASIRNDIFERCSKAGVPAISHGLVVDGVCSVISDNTIGMVDLARHLISKHGVKKIKFLAGSADNEDSNIRIRAVKDVASENGLVFSDDDIVYTNWDLVNCENAVFDSIRSGNKPDVFICANDELAMTAICALEKEGLTVPGDVLVTGFDCLSESQVFYPSVSSVDQNSKDHGKVCARLIRDMMDGKKSDPVVQLPCAFIPSESCGCKCPPKSAERRLRSGIIAFKSTQQANAAAWHSLYIERVIMACDSFNEIKRSITNTLSGNHRFEGTDFHILFDPSCYRSEMGSDVVDDNYRYSEKMDVIVSIRNNSIQNIRSIKTTDLIPGIEESDPPHMYVFLPAHDRGNKIGYVVFTDCYDKIESKAIREFMEKFNSAVEKARKAIYLQAINDTVRELSHVDALTHVKNRNAYEVRLEEVRKKTAGKSNPSFGIVLFDINDLKKINDELGHYSGDEYIKNSCKLICTIYKNSPVYRIGGDEFVVILEGKPFEHRDDLLDEFKSEMKKLATSNRPAEEKVSIAYGMSIYQKGDTCIDDVIKRADVTMYNTKKKMKAAKK